MEQKYPLSFTQQMLWALQQSQPVNPFYNQCFGFRIKGVLKIPLLEKSLQMMTVRHCILRTSFIMSDNLPLQQVEPSLDAKLRLDNLKNTDKTDINAILQKKVKNEAIRPFHLEKAPLFRAVLYILDHEEFFFQFTIHHLICDGISMVIFFNELSSYYNSLIRSEAVSIEPANPDYLDFILHQYEWEKSVGYSAQFEYWKDHLNNIPPIQLPVDYKRSRTNTYQGKTHGFDLPEELATGLKILSQANGLTLYTMLFTLFQVLLYRYCGQSDFGIGIPVTNRLKREFRNTIGLFMNTIVIRGNLDGNPAFTEQLSRVWDTIKTGYGYQGFPFNKLVNGVQAERHSNFNPLFQVLFDFREYEEPKPQFPGTDIELVEIETDTSKFDLSLIIIKTGEKLRCNFEYSTGLFHPATITGLEAGFAALSRGVLENPRQRIGLLPLFDPAEYRKICNRWNDTREKYPRKWIHELIEEQVVLSKNRIAVRFRDEEITYDDLNQKANSLARFILRKCPTQNTVIGVCLERSINMVAALIAVMKSGNAYIPIDPHYPDERIGFMLNDAGASLLITETVFQGKFSGRFNQCIIMDGEWEQISREDPANIGLNPDPENLAYIIYTSGSTGKPKGVPIRHRSVSNFLSSMRERPGMNRDDVLLALTTISFDIAGLEIYLPLITGARIILMPHDDTHVGEKIIQSLERHGVTMIQATPASYRILLASGWRGKPDLKILCGGEALPSDLAYDLVKKAESVWNMYGPTETTIWSSVYRVGSNPEYNHLSFVPIGFPIANTQFYVVDANLQLVPVGVAGELLIGGDGLSPGYINRIDLTGEKFIKNPLLDATGSFLYRTGDLVKRLPDGNLEFLGRIDQQIKIRGYRIEIEEIEAVLNEHPEVVQSVVTVKTYNTNDKRMVAHLVPRSFTNPDPIPGLTEYLSSKLPAYMIPSSFCIIDKMPLTSNGKINRKALPEESLSLLPAKKQYVEPESDLQKSLAGIWKEVLQVVQVGMHDNFFDIGGDSYLIIIVADKISVKLGKTISVVDLFQYPTLKSLAEFLSPMDQAQSANFDDITARVRKQKESKQRNRNHMMEKRL